MAVGAGRVVPHGGDGAEERLSELRRMYEPYVPALAQHLLMPLPAWRAGVEPHENWRTTSWGRSLRGASSRPVDPHDDSWRPSRKFRNPQEERALTVLDPRGQNHNHD